MLSDPLGVVVVMHRQDRHIRVLDRLRSCRGGIEEDRWALIAGGERPLVVRDQFE